MNLKQIKADLDRGMLISPCTWVEVLERAIADHEDAALWRWSMAEQDNLHEHEALNAMWRKVYAEHRLKPTGEEYIAASKEAMYAAIGKPDGEGA